MKCTPCYMLPLKDLRRTLVLMHFGISLDVHVCACLNTKHVHKPVVSRVPTINYIHSGFTTESNLATQCTRPSECSLTVALSKTLMVFSSAMFLFRRASSSVQSGSVSHFPKTTRSMSLMEKSDMTGNV